ncbi:MAG: hypothetical protein HC877_17545 [Thioploca sp.]|nr:hypothetical protein [Thioploca sp.]
MDNNRCCRYQGYFSAHARVLTKIVGTGNRESTYFTFNDPITGTERTESFLDFLSAYEQMGTDNTSKELLLPIVHFRDSIYIYSEDYSKISAWPNLDTKAVLTRIKELRNDANLFNQGNIGLCTAASFFHHVIQKEPDEFELFAKHLLKYGTGYLGKFKVEAGSDLRRADYNGLNTKYKGEMPPQADWMLISSLRDTENWILDYEGGPDEDKAIRTDGKELSEWYEKTGFYNNVIYSEETTEIRTINKTQINHIALLIRASLFPGYERKSGHVITLESSITIDETNNKVNFDYWTWGFPIQTLNTTLTTFQDNYLGVIIATF